MKSQITVAIATFLSVVAFDGDAAEFKKLNGAPIRAKFAGMELTDEVHWYDLYERNGTVLSSSMGRKRTGKWRIERTSFASS